MHGILNTSVTCTEKRTIAPLKYWPLLDIIWSVLNDAVSAFEGLLRTYIRSYHVYDFFLICTDFGAIHVTKRLGVITWENKISSSIAKCKAVKTELYKSLKSQSRLNFSNPATSDEVLKITEAEVKIVVLTASCNIPFTFHDQLSLTIRSVFLDSKIAVIIL